MPQARRSPGFTVPKNPSPRERATELVRTDSLLLYFKLMTADCRQLDFELVHDAAADSREDDVKGHAAIPVRRQSTSRPGKGGKTSRKGGKKGSKR